MPESESVVAGYDESVLLSFVGRKHLHATPETWETLRRAIPSQPAPEGPLGFPSMVGGYLAGVQVYLGHCPWDECHAGDALLQFRSER